MRFALRACCRPPLPPEVRARRVAVAGAAWRHPTAKRTTAECKGELASSPSRPSANYSPSQSLKRLRQREPQTVAQNGGTAAPDLVVNLAARIAAAEVRQDDHGVLKTLREIGDVIEVDVAVARGALLMPVHHERAFDHQHFGPK